MSDLSTGGAPAEGIVEAPAPAADPFDNAETTTFDRKYVESLRSEAAKHRTAAKEAAAARDKYHAVFNKWGDEDSEVLLRVLDAAADDPTSGAEQLREIARVLAGDIQETPSKPAAPAQGTALTQEDLDRVLTEREQAAHLKSEVAAIESEAVSLGYEKGSADYFKLLWLAKEKTNFDLKAAHERIKEEEAAVVAKYLAGKKAEAEGNPGAGPEGGAAPSDARPITNLKEASASARARINAARSRK